MRRKGRNKRKPKYMSVKVWVVIYRWATSGEHWVEAFHDYKTARWFHLNKTYSKNFRVVKLIEARSRGMR